MDSTDISLPRPSFSWLRVGLTLLPLLAALGIVTGYLILTNQWEAQAALEQDGLARFGLAKPTTNRLAARFVDANADLVADAPEDESQWLDPPVLSFSYVAAENSDEQAALWQTFMDHLAQHAQRKVEYTVCDDTEQQLTALEEGRLHIAGLNTGAVPRAVNVCGFVPVATLGRADGSFGYKMQIIVPSGSPIERVEDLRGKQLTFTTRNSNSGFKAPVVLLKNDFDLLPERDYSWGFSHSHQESIARIAAGDLDAAAVASDIVARAVASNAIEEDQIHVVYESPSFPPASFGYAYNLNPELAAQLREAILSFQIAETPLEEEFAGAGVTQFVPIDYRDDWATIRRINDALGTEHAAE